MHARHVAGTFQGVRHALSCVGGDDPKRARAGPASVSIVEGKKNINKLDVLLQDP